MRNTTDSTKAALRGIPAVLPETPPLIAFYSWLLETSERKREMNNILASFENRGSALYIKGTEDTLEAFFLRFQSIRQHKSVADYAMMMDHFHDFFRTYYKTNSLINPGYEVAREIEEAIPPVKQFLEDAISTKGVVWIPESVDAIMNKMTS